jgi:chromosome segregation ATPase
MDFIQERQKLEQRRQDLEKNKKEWEIKKKDLFHDLRLQSESIEKYLGKIERGINVVGNLEYHVDQIKKVFEEIEDAESSIKSKEDDIESEEKDLKLEEQHGRNREMVARVSRKMGTHI